MTSLGRKFKMAAPMRILKAEDFHSYLDDKLSKETGDKCVAHKKRSASVGASELVEYKRFVCINSLFNVTSTSVLVKVLCFI